MNTYTWIGILLIGVTWFFIQKGAKVSAEVNKEELKSKLDSVQTEAIKKINSTTDSTILRINESANEIIGNLKMKAEEIEGTIIQLEKLTRKSTKNISENIQQSKTETISKVESESHVTRKQIVADGEVTRSKIIKGNTSDLLKSQFVEGLFPVLVDYKTSWDNAVTNLYFISQIRDYQFSEKDKSTENLNATMDAVNRVRAEIVKLKAFKEYIISKGEIKKYNKIEVYLNKLDRPFIKAMNRPKKGEKTGKEALYNIHKEHFNEFKNLFNEFETITSIVLSIE